MSAEPPPPRQRRVLIGCLGLALLLTGCGTLLCRSALIGSETRLGPVRVVATRSRQWRLRTFDAPVSREHPELRINGLQVGPLVWVAEWRR